MSDVLEDAYLAVRAYMRYGVALLSEVLTNSNVRILKQDMRNIGWNGLTFNNTFDSGLEQAVRALQDLADIDIDSVVGNQTKDAHNNRVTSG